MVVNVFQWILFFLCGVENVLYISLLLKPKIGSVIKNFIIVFLFTNGVALAVQLLFGYKIVPFLPFAMPIKTVINFAFHFIAILCFYKGKFLYKMFVFLSLFALMFMCDGLSSVLYGTLTGNSLSDLNNKLYSSERLLVSFFFLFIFSILTLSMVFLLRKKAIIKIDKKTFFISVIFPVIQIYMICISFYANRGKYSQSFFIYSFIEMILCFFVDVIVVFILQGISKSAELQARLKWSEGLKETENLYYESLKSKSKEIMKIRHEINDRIQTALIMMESDDPLQKERARDILEKTFDDLSKTKIPVYCENSICNIILNEKVIEMDKLGIKYEFNIIIPDELVIKDVDLCSIFSNLLNNAIEECKKCIDDCPIILVNAKIAKEYFAVSVKNTLSSSPVTKDGKLVTSKQNKKMHGFGTELLKDIAESYDGDYSYETADGFFTAKIIIKAFKDENISSKK